MRGQEDGGLAKSKSVGWVTECGLKQRMCSERGTAAAAAAAARLATKQKTIMGASREFEKRSSIAAQLRTEIHGEVPTAFWILGLRKPEA